VAVDYPPKKFSIIGEIDLSSNERKAVKLRMMEEGLTFEVNKEIGI
jgi:hypothetical protein